MLGLKEKITSVAESLGIFDIGFADVTLWDSDPLVSSRISSEFRPKSILSNSESVIVIGIPIPSSILDTAPSIAYAQTYKNINSMLDMATQRIAMELMNLGFDAMPLPRDGYHGISGLRESSTAFFSHRHAAYLAGLGSFGNNNVLLTGKYGPRIRFSSIITNAKLSGKGPIGKDLCIYCGKCVRECPAKALKVGKYTDMITNKELCIDRSEMLAKQGISPCGICVSVCPVGRKQYGGKPTDESIKVIRSYVKR